LTVYDENSNIQEELLLLKKQKAIMESNQANSEEAE
jgi:hypothetical protein